MKQLAKGITMTDYMQEIAKILKLADVPGVEILQSDEAIFEALKGYISSQQDIAVQADTWRLAAENWQADNKKMRALFVEASEAIGEIARALIDSENVPTDKSDTESVAAIVVTVKRALEYLDAARDSARMYSAQLANAEKSTERTISDRTAELRQKIDVLESQVSFHRDTAKNLEGHNEGLAAALRIVLDTRGR